MAHYKKGVGGYPRRKREHRQNHRDHSGWFGNQMRGRAKARPGKRSRKVSTRTWHYKAK